MDEKEQVHRDRADGLQRKSGGMVCGDNQRASNDQNAVREAAREVAKENREILNRLATK